MKKVLLATLVAAGVASAIAPKFISDNADANLTQMVENVDKLPGYKASVVTLEKSWFRSKSKVIVGLDLLEMDPNLATQSPEAATLLEDLQFDLFVDMQHGPVLLNKGLGLSDIQISIPNSSDKIKNNEENIENIYLFDGKLNLFGDLSYSDSISAMQFEFPDDSGQLSFSGYQGKGTVESDIAEYTGNSATFKVNSPEMNLSMSDFTITLNGDFDLEKIMLGIYGNSESSFVIGELKVEQAAQPLFGMKGLELYGNSVVDDTEVMDVEMGYRIATVDTPLDTIENIEIAFELNNVDSKLMTTYNEMLFSGKNLQADEEQLLEEFKAPLIEALSHQPEMKIANMGFSNTVGTLTSNATLKLADYNIDSTQFENGEFWKKNLVVESGVNLPKDMALDLAKKMVEMQLQPAVAAGQYTPEQVQELSAQQSEMMLNNFMQGGILVENNGQLQLAFNIKDGTANLNGNPIPLEALFPAE